MIGWIFMIGGVVGLLFTTLIWGPRNRARTVSEPAEYRRVEERTEI